MVWEPQWFVRLPGRGLPALKARGELKSSRAIQLVQKGRTKKHTYAGRGVTILATLPAMRSHGISTHCRLFWKVLLLTNILRKSGVQLWIEWLNSCGQLSYCNFRQWHERDYLFPRCTFMALSIKDFHWLTVLLEQFICYLFLIIV